MSSSTWSSLLTENNKSEIRFWVLAVDRNRHNTSLWLDFRRKEDSDSFSSFPVFGLLTSHPHPLFSPFFSPPSILLLHLMFFTTFSIKILLETVTFLQNKYISILLWIKRQIKKESEEHFQDLLSQTTCLLVIHFSFLLLFSFFSTTPSYIMLLQTKDPKDQKGEEKWCWFNGVNPSHSPFSFLLIFFFSEFSRSFSGIH